ncbi:MAG: cation diffusion facilitator family transporter [Chloroflexota bacterium]
MGVNHSHGTHLPSGARQLKIALAIVLSVMAVEVVGGILSNSLALLSDAGHMLVDALALGLALAASSLAAKAATSKKTFGYYRAEIMAALANGTILLLAALYIFYQAYSRFRDPPEVEAPLMLLVASIGLGANLGSMLVLRRAQRRSLNIRAALWHVIGDTVSSLGVIGAAIVIYFTGWLFADPAIAVVIGCIILWGAVRLVGESVNILLESVPSHMRLDEVASAMTSVPGVEDVHDLHVWTLTSGMYALSAHLVITDQMVSSSEQVVRDVNDRVAHDFSINHTTLQLECHTCPSGFVCQIGEMEEK